MFDIVLTTLNARYCHTAFGLRYLMANLGGLTERAIMLEFDLQRPLPEVAAAIARHHPRIIGIGVYIWNTDRIQPLLPLLRHTCPQASVVLGGPEVIAEIDSNLESAADYIVQGEGEAVFPSLCNALLTDQPPAQKILSARPVDPTQIQLPYELYDDQDIRHRMIYVETSRGCPFGCEYCLSSRDRPVRYMDISAVLGAFEGLLARGVLHFKFVDRTFNLDLNRCLAILQFFLDRHRPGLFLHVEMVPALFPDELKAIIRRFPFASLQVEMGVQTFNPEVAARIHRPQSNEIIADNLRFLRQQTGAYLHADLIAGLPGESLESFSSGFDRLVALHPHEIQVGILKRLKGTALDRHTVDWDMRYNPHPPYELKSNKLLSPETMMRLQHYAHFWDAFYNSGNFIESTPRIWAESPSVFEAFLKFSDWIYALQGREHGIPLATLAENLFSYLTERAGQPAQEIADLILRDYQRSGRRDTPPLLQPLATATHKAGTGSTSLHRGLQRQMRHLLYRHE